MKNSFDYLEELPSAVTVCDTAFSIIYMNLKSRLTFSPTAGNELIGQNLLDCHSEASRLKIREIMESGLPNSYTIEKNGIKKLIHQSPWFSNGAIAGLIEISLVIPNEMPHFIRQ